MYVSAGEGGARVGAPDREGVQRQLAKRSRATVAEIPGDCFVFYLTLMQMQKNLVLFYNAGPKSST